MKCKRYVRIVSMAMAVVFAFAAAGCGKKTSEGKFKWIDSNLPGCGDKVDGIRLQDDFAAAANAEWLKSQTYDPVNKNGTFHDAQRTVDKNMRVLIDDSSVTGKNIELVRAFDGLYSDWDKRDELGAEPLRKYLERIDRIETVEDVEDYMLDNDGNPFAVMLFTLGTVKNDNKEDHLCLRLTQPSYSLGSSSFYSSDKSKIDSKKAVVLDKVSHVLTKLGYADSEIKQMVDSCVEFETKMAGINPGGDKSDYFSKVVGKSDFLSTTTYDMNSVLDHYGLGDTVNYTGDLSFLKGLDRVLRSENIEGIKAYFKVQLITKSLLLLDTDTFDYSQKAALNKDNPFAEVSVSYKDRYLFHTIQGSPLSAAMDQAYLDAYYDQKVYDDICGMLEDLRDGYKEIISGKDWLSADSKANIIEKLENMIFCVIRPSNEADYGDMSFASYDEGGTILDAYAKLNRFKIAHYGDLTRMAYDRGFWDIYDTRMSTTKVGDQYDTWHNKIFVHIGILNDGIYSYDMSEEDKLGGIGTVLGHEMSHAFDSNGVYYDKNGDYNSIISGSDLDKFTAMADKVSEYYGYIKPFDDGEAYSPDNTLAAETIADMGGVSCTLRIAAKRSGFDYDRYFRAYASLWRRLTSKSDQFDTMRTGSHALAYLRINIPLQQFDKFYETYNIQPEDNMYLSPDERIAIW